jgi:hypothetical protein
MITTIITPHLTESIFYLPGVIKRWRDRGHTCNEKVTKQILQEDYNELYLGEEFAIEERYATIIGSFYIYMLLSAGMPGLYIVGFFEVFILYWVDKARCKYFSH